MGSLVYRVILYLVNCSKWVALLVAVVFVLHESSKGKRWVSLLCTRKFFDQLRKRIASGSRLMETAERQFCILSTMTFWPFCCYESGINNHRRLSILSQVSRSKRYLISTPPEVFPDVSTLRGRDQSHSVQRQQSEWPTAERSPNNNRQNAGWYTPDVAPSTLLFLAGPKDCVEDSIPEIGRLFCNSPLWGNLLWRLKQLV